MKTTLILSLLIFYFSNLSFVIAEVKPIDLQKKLEKSVNNAQNAQKKADAWAEKQRAYLDEIRDLKNLKRWLKHQKGKYQTYIEKQNKTLEELERRKKESEKIKIELEPFLDDLFVRLEEFIKQDLPFLSEERQRRLQFLKAALDNYHLGLAEKTKQVLEALQIEAGYGKTIEKNETTIEVDNVSIQVNLFRLGRTALFYQSLDGKEIGWFNWKKQAYEALPVKYGRAIQRAMEISEKKRTPELLNLPVGRIKE
ncbi:UCP028069 [Candidatus Magnetomoraceae bacterium gMMP-15]